MNLKFALFVSFVMAIILGAGGSYFAYRNVQKSTTPETVDISTNMLEESVASTTLNARFAIDLPGEIRNSVRHQITTDLVPFEIDTTRLSEPDYPTMYSVPSIVVSIVPVGTTTPVYTFPFGKGTTYYPMLSIPSDLINGLYTLQAYIVYPELETCCSKPSVEDYASWGTPPPPALLYRTQLQIDRQVANSDSVSIKMTYPINASSPAYVNTDVLDLDQPMALLAFEMINNSSFPVQIQALQLEDSLSMENSDTTFAHIRSLSLSSVDDAKTNVSPLSSLSLLTDFIRYGSGGYTSHPKKTYLIDTPIIIAPGGTKHVVLFGIIDADSLVDNWYYKIGGYYAFRLSGLLGKSGSSLLRKETSLETGFVSEKFNSGTTTLK